MDYRQFAMDELSQIGALRAAETVCRDRLAELKEQLEAARCGLSASTPVKGGRVATEDRWLGLLAHVDDEEKRLKNVRHRLHRFETAWSALGERDQSVLDVFYIQRGKNCAAAVAQREHCDERTAFRWRDEALLCFTRALYGCILE